MSQVTPTVTTAATTTAKKSYIILIIALGVVSVIVAGVSIWWFKFRDSDSTDSNGNSITVKPMKARLSINPATGQDTDVVISNNNNSSNVTIVSNANRNAQSDAEFNADQSQTDLNVMLDTSESNEASLNSTIALIEQIELSEGSIDPLVLDGVSTMETQVEESNVLTEDAVIANLEIAEIMAETEGSVDTAELFVVVEHLVPATHASDPYRISNSSFESNSNSNSNSNNEPMAANAANSQASVAGQERASEQGVSDGGKSSQTTRVSTNLRSSTALSSNMDNMKLKINRRKERQNIKKERVKKRMASSPKLNEKQVEVEQRLAEKIQERDAKIARLETKLTQKREARHSRKEARDLIKQIRMSKIADLKGQIYEKGRIISQLNHTIQSIFTGDGNPEDKRAELLALIKQVNSDYTLLESDGDGDGKKWK